LPGLPGAQACDWTPPEPCPPPRDFDGGGNRRIFQARRSQQGEIIMLPRSLVVAIALFACAAIPLSGAQARSNNGSHNNHNGHGAMSHPASPGKGMAQAKQKKPRKSLGPITFTKHYDKGSTYLAK
jgi:hypothetical protein